MHDSAWVFLHSIDWIILEHNSAPSNNNHQIPPLRHNILICSTLIHFKKSTKSRTSSLNLTVHSINTTSQHLGLKLIGLHLNNICSPYLLILRPTIFVVPVQVEPDLESLCGLVEAAGHLGVDEAATCGHPLHVAGTEGACISGGVLVEQATAEQVCEGLHASMRVVRESGWQFSLEVVEEEERVEVGWLLSTEVSAYLGADTWRLLRSCVYFFYFFEVEWAFCWEKGSIE